MGRILTSVVLFISVAIAFPQNIDLPKKVSNREGLWALIDAQGNLLTDYKYTEMDEWHGTNRMRVRANGKYGYLDVKGREVIKCRYDYLDKYDGVYAYPILAGNRIEGNENSIGYINLNGDYIISPKYQMAYGFSEGLAAVKENGKWGFIDIQGNYAIKPQFKQASPFKEDLASVQINNGKRGYINREGIFVIKPQYAIAHAFSSGTALVSYDGQKAGYINRFGNPLTSFSSSILERNGTGLYNLKPEIKASIQKWKEVLEEMADKGDRIAAYYLGWAYDGFPFTKSVIEQDSAKALKWFLQSAYGGSYMSLGLIYYNRGEMNKAIHNFEMASMSNVIRSWNWLGFIYELQNNIEKAYYYYEKSASWEDLYAKERLLALGEEDITKKYTQNKTYSISISFLDNTNFLSNSSYQMRACIKSKSRLTSIQYYLNGTLLPEDRTASFVKNDGCDFTIEKIFSLQEGANKIEIKARDANGLVAEAEKTVSYNRLTPAPIRQERRFALVIGNRNYTYRTLPPLKNAINDADDMAAKLSSLGFTVTTIPDANRNQMYDAINKFMRDVENSDVALIYYSGHGLSPKGGANYLLPTDSKIDYQDEIEQYGINSQTILLSRLEKANVRAKIILLDCCNNCNVPERGAKSTTHAGGLSEMKPEGVYILHAAQPGKTASDDGGNGRNSPFVTSFLECCDKYSYLSWNDFAPKVITTVKARTNKCQIPYPEGYIEGQLYLKQK